MKSQEILYLSRADVEAVGLKMGQIIDSVEAAFREKGLRRVEMPPKPGVHPGGNTFAHAMPACIPSLRSVGIKWVSGNPENPKQGIPYINGLIILNDPETVAPVPVMDCTWSTAKRTGAASAVAARRLARPDSRTLGLLGAGVQALSHLEALTCLFPIERVAVYDVVIEVQSWPTTGRSLAQIEMASQAVRRAPPDLVLIAVPAAVTMSAPTASATAPTRRLPLSASGTLERALTMGRVSEVNRLTWNDVNFDERYVVLYTRKKRGGHLTPRKVPMPDKLHDVLSRRYASRAKEKPWVFWHRFLDHKKKEWLEGPYLERKKIMTTLCKKAGVRYFRFHALRHFGASMLDQARVPISSIQHILGHENRSTTEIYLQSHVAVLMESLPPGEEFFLY